MDEQLIGRIVEEVRAALAGRAWGRVFQLSRAALAVEFRPGEGLQLQLSAEPNRPRLHLARRNARELERASQPPSGFAQLLRKRLGGATLLSVEQDAGERVVRLRFDAEDETGARRAPTLVAQLTGRTANLFLLDEAGRVADALRPARGPGQEAGELYAPPKRNDAGVSPRSGEGSAAPSPEKTKEGRKEGRKKEAVSLEGFATLSEALDARAREEERARAFDQRAGTAAAKLRQETARLSKLRANLERDLAAHGDADSHKRIGDLLLANLANAVRDGRRVLVTDYFAEGAPTIEIEVDENRTLQEEAAARFARYGKAKRAAQEVARRLAEVEQQLSELARRRGELERLTAARDEAALEEFVGGRADKQGRKPVRGGGAQATRAAKKAAAESVPGVRRYRSSDGHEILVGRGSRDNDHLTFRVARSYDLWMHAADYPGSHVVVRAQGRDAEVPHRTVIEAARLAAHFSRAGKDAKVAVNYAPRKFVSKPKGAAPGLVYLSSFRTILVEPGEALERI